VRSSIKDFDARAGTQAPTTRQQDAARGKGLVARWNLLGTPDSLSRPGGYLATGLSADPVTAARQWIGDNSDVLGLPSGGANSLDVVATNPIGAGAAVWLQQRFSGLAAGLDGQIVVGVAGGKVVYVSSTLSPDETLSGTATLSAADGLRAAAANLDIPVGDVREAGTENGWTLLEASTQHQVQKAKLVAVPTPETGVRPAWEAGRRRHR
jgi:extracellular elastinolytic metalloproteinase